MGVPVVSLIGDHHCARVGLTLLTAAGLPHLATSDRSAFPRIAAKLTEDLPRLAALRARLREQMRASTLCDGRGLARKVESIYREAWVKWCRSEL